MESKYIYTAQDVFKHVLFLRYQPRECLRVLFITADNKLIHSMGVSKGTEHSVSFMARDIFRTGIICNASGIILVHNHPSGNVEPSKEDIEVTKQLRRIGDIIGIHVIDHIIVTKTTFKSMIKNQ